MAPPSACFSPVLVIQLPSGLDWGLAWQYYPLRPELMESTYLLHAATGDARYQRAGRTMQRTLLKRNKAACGFASLADTASGAVVVPRGS